MCGIIGFNWEDKSLIIKGLNAINHRGPDDRGTYSDERISLGHNRLSIIDLSKSGKQPMTNESNDIWITFNGEIYNYKNLKEGLRKKHSFKSNTDTEVMLHLYEEEGLDMLNKLEGMFAFCIYDSKKKLLFLARDRAGIKPLYYYSEKNKFMFASEIKALLENDEIKRELNQEALSPYLMFRANTSEETFFKNIYKLKPGHLLIYNLANNLCKIAKYWDCKISPQKFSFTEASNKLRQALGNSVQSQLVSDVPYGAFLSGGIDSGAIVALMSKHVSSPIKTFSVGFANQDNELSKAKLLADEIGTDHHELVLDESSIKYLPEVVYQGDEPMADPTSIPTYLLSRYTRRYCTVVLTGEGADELFGGYPQYKFMKLHNLFIKKTPALIRNAGLTAANLVPKSILSKGFSYSSALGDKGLERFSNYVRANSYAQQYLEQISIFNQQEQKELYGYNQNIYLKYDKKYFKHTTPNTLINSCELLDFKESMVDDLLMKLDKNTMAFSLEGRVPFLDTKVIELGFSLNDKFKLSLAKNKILLRNAVKDIVPKETALRKKRHFFVPIDSWISTLSDLKGSLLSKRFIEKQKIFNYSYIEKINNNFSKSRLFYARQLWSILTFQIWYKQYIEHDKIKL